MKLGVQMFSVKNAIEKDMPGTLKQIAQMGYQGFEFFGGFWWSAQAVRRAAEEAGLEIIGWHTPYAALEKPHLHATVAYAKQVGLRHVTLPLLPPDMCANAAAWHESARRLDEIAGVFEDEGIVFGYHNHVAECKTVEGLKTGWDIIMSETSSSMCGQLDNGNALSGGRDALTYLKKYPGRAYTFHLKPYSLENGFATMIGEDSIPWAETLQELQKQNVTEWGIVEYACSDLYDEFEGIRRCYQALQKIEKEATLE